MKFITLLFASFSNLALAAEPPMSGNLPKDLKPSDWSGIRAVHETARHAVRCAKDGTLVARNPGQQWVAEFDAAGFTVTPDHGQWTWGLTLTGYGERTISSSSTLSHDRGKVTCQRDPSLTEWFINDTRGLEQGWTFHQRPDRSDPAAPLLLHLSTRGNLSPQVSADGTGVSFQHEGGSALTYGGLKAWDADGKVLVVRFEQAAERDIRIAIEDHNARYPVTIDPIAQQAYLKAGIPEMNDKFGYSVSISGDTVVIGADGEDSSSTGVNGNQADNSASRAGAAYVFIRSGNTWTEQAYLKASNASADGSFGWSVAISGDTIVVGALWEASNAVGVNGTQTTNNVKDSGAAYIFTRSGTTWTQQAYLKASNAGASDWFGCSVAVEGDTVVVGAINESSGASGVNGNQADNSVIAAGAAYVFRRNGTVWTQAAYLKASNPTQGGDFGDAVAVAGDLVAVGAPDDDSSATGVDGNPSDIGATDSGAVSIFKRNGVTWTAEAYLKASNTGAGDEFGASLAIARDTLVVGSPYEDSNATGENGDQANNAANNAGAIYIFIRSAGIWSQQSYLKASNAGADDVFGNSVAISGDVVVVGAMGERSNASGVNGNQASNYAIWIGAAYAFGRNGTTWTQHAYLKSSNPDYNDYFGRTVAVSGDTVVAGAHGESSSNGNPANNAASFSGAAYIFNGVEAVPSPGLTITGTAKSGASFTIDFTAAAGLTGWQVKGSANLETFPDDLTAVTTFTELTPGNYRAVVDVTNAPAFRYFMRIER